ncbi:Lrp/AsnC family transcriptional regulator [Lactiplantibacillus mudanjiangensis]|uniref:HTH-type transcriptional regulator lrpA [Lactobacillus brevis KB290] n=1 Tax=Lactiplantibacillus mudanjiangensis TaxID=1296538 RepID=A0A660E4R2_9LACO|nr:AsnC family transcriptional regulator [Lactiplantibacillus mudanjiangensis]VDG21041.1 HTH-type transcriptional regulator lrpA [Lactobacillus brevis KB290] [Lactiplantibacillus mudanjiangensis]VDG26046.1 HTH-type transcriptional regulator lrpA [Lactobacillus brevis KB290] [Lactiplantibacillus mudanjiangensis]VDG29116.1 HTH-type transcriptional regulator lrpA [Lactobacillus brevis KB290] [Lactiplantibacillus mudanjiangensis]
MTDPTDLAIIKALNKNCRLKVSHLAKQVHLTAPAVAARIERLETTGVIKNYTIEIDLVKMGLQRQVFIQAGLKKPQHAAYFAFIQAHHNAIRHHYHTTGELNYLIEAAFFDNQDLDTFLQALGQLATYRVIDIVAEDF